MTCTGPKKVYILPVSRGFIIWMLPLARYKSVRCRIKRALQYTNYFVTAVVIVGYQPTVNYFINMPNSPGSILPATNWVVTLGLVIFLKTVITISGWPVSAMAYTAQQ